MVAVGCLELVFDDYVPVVDQVAAQNVGRVGANRLLRGLEFSSTPRASPNRSRLSLVASQGVKFTASLGHKAHRLTHSNLPSSGRFVGVPALLDL